MTTVVFKAIATNGAPIKGAIIDVTLITAGVEYLGEAVVLPTTLKGITDAAGEFQADLQPIMTHPYVLVCTDPATKRKGVYEFYVPESEAPVNISDLVLYPPPSGVTYDAIALAHIVNERVLAQQAAESVDTKAAPRYIPKAIAFTDGDYALVSTDNNGFLRVPGTEGSVVIPLDDTINFPIGAAIVFARDPASEDFEADIEFVGETVGVTITAIKGSEVKLKFKKDIVTLVKIGANSWTIHNTSESTLEEIEFSLFNTANAISNIDVAIATLNGWREAFNLQLVQTVGDVVNNTNSISVTNNTLASITSFLISLENTIQNRVNAVLPQASSITYNSLISGLNVNTIQEAIDILAATMQVGQQSNNIVKTENFMWLNSHHLKTCKNDPAV